MLVLLGASQISRMNRKYPQGNCISLAVSGATVCKVNSTPCLRDILRDHLLKQRQGAHATDTLILLGGSNDILKNVTFSDFRAHFRRLIVLAVKHFRRVVVARIPPIPLLSDSVNDKINGLNGWMASYCSGLRVVVADTFAPFLDPISRRPDFRFYEMYYPRRRGRRPKRDRVHLNRLGLAVLYQCFREAVNS